MKEKSKYPFSELWDELMGNVASLYDHVQDEDYERSDYIKQQFAKQETLPEPGEADEQQHQLIEDFTFFDDELLKAMDKITTLRNKIIAAYTPIGGK